jgi:predicted transposase/invertase (TIGR01784 family)
MRFLDVKTDYAFKKVFGSENSKYSLISFLNSIIYKNRDTKILDLTIVDPYNIPMLEGMKDTYVDVKAKLDNNTTVIIEMQVLNHQGLEKRILYNATKTYSIQLSKNEDYHLLEPVIGLTILDFNMFKDSNKVISSFRLLEQEDYRKYSDDIELIFVELPKFDKEIDELEDITDQWIYFVKNSGSLEYKPDSFNDEVQNALDTANQAGMSEEELEIQRKRKEFIYIQKNSIELAIEEGIERGIERGIEQRNIEIAKSLLGLLDTQTISAKTGLSVEQVQSLSITPPVNNLKNSNFI